MHIDARATNLIASWVLVAGDEMRTAVEHVVGMSGGAPAALVAIAAEPGMSIDALRRALRLTHPGTVRLVDRLVERDMVIRDPGVGRAVALRPTKNGLLVYKRVLAARQETVQALLATLSAPAINQLADLISPMLVSRVQNEAELRRLCRLCDRVACEPCPPWAHLSDHAEIGE